MAATYPTRIVCLTEETTETLYLLGEEARIVGISGFTVRPPRARREKPRVSAFTTAKIEKIVEKVVAQVLESHMAAARHELVQKVLGEIQPHLGGASDASADGGAMGLCTVLHHLHPMLPCKFQNCRKISGVSTMP